MKPNTKPEQWMEAGISEHREFVESFNRAKQHALNAGFFFLSARLACPHGQWAEVQMMFNHLIPSRTVDHYLRFAMDALEWAKEENPGLKQASRLQECARELVIQSPKSLVALCRELSLMRRFGEYDQVKYQKQKLREAGQMEFRFEQFIGQIGALLTDQKVEKLAVSSLQQMEEDLAEALDRVREVRARRATQDQSNVIDISTEEVA